MFGELSVMAWLGGAIILAIGGGAGFFTARQIKDKRTLELEQQLDSAQNKLTEYQSDVNRHFLKTSLLFNKLTDDYREVYEHLATGAQKLCNEKPIVTALDLPETKILAAAITSDSSKPVDEEKPATENLSTSPAESEHDDTAHLGAEGIVATEDINTTNTETEPAENTEQPEQIMAEQATTDPLPTEASVTESTETEVTIAETKPTDDRPTISPEELKILEAETQKKIEEEDIHLGAESTPGVELEHHKTHPSIH